MDMMEHVFLAVIAGGQGTRLFPFSHPERPKQFCQLNNKDTFIQAAIKNFTSLGVRPENVIVIVTNDAQEKLAREQTMPRGVLAMNIVKISDKFGYAGAMIEAAKFIKEIDSNAIIINTPSDQYLTPNEEFEVAIKNAVKEAAEGRAIVIGTKVQDEVVAMGLGHAIFNLSDNTSCPKIKEFVEKPDLKKVRELQRRRDSVANTGINVWSVDRILADTKDTDYSHGLKTEDMMNGALMSSLDISVGQFNWHDCGTLESLYQVSEKGPQHKNANIGEGFRQRNDCLHSLFICDAGFRLFCTGVKKEAVVVSMINDKPVVVIVSLEDSQTVKQLAEKFEANQNYLLEDFCFDAHNNDVMRSNVKYVAGFVGVNSYVVNVYEHKKDNENSTFDVYVAKKVTSKESN